MSTKICDLRSLSEGELLSMRKDLCQKVLQIRFRSKIEPPKDFMEIRRMKRNIARINTLLHELEL